MKRFAALSAVVALCASMAFSLNAKVEGVGLFGGLTSSAAPVENLDVKNATLYHAGVAYKFALPYGFGIQPQLMYQVKGAKASEMLKTPVGNLSSSFDTNVGYLELPVQLQWGPDLVMFRPYVFAEPFVGYAVNAKQAFSVKGSVLGVETEPKEQVFKDIKDMAIKRLEYGLGIGGGIEFWQLQLSAKYFWNFGHLTDSDGELNLDDIESTVKDAFAEAQKDRKSFSGFMISLGFFF